MSLQPTGDNHQLIKNKPRYFGIWNARAKEFQFGIVETSARKASQKLFQKIGKDSYKWRFEVKELKHGNPKAKPLLDKIEQRS